MLAGSLKPFWPLSVLPELTGISGGLYAKKRQLVRLTYLGRCDLYYNCSLCDYFEGWATESCRRDVQLYFCNAWNVLCSFQNCSLLFRSKKKFWKSAGVFVKSNFKCSPFFLSPLSAHRPLYVGFLADISNCSECACIPFKAASPSRSEVTRVFFC